MKFSAKPFVRFWNFINSDIDQRDAQGNTTLHRAITDNNIDQVRNLIKQGADPSKKNRLGQDCLDILIQNFEIYDNDFIKIVLNAQDVDGNNALHREVLNKDEKKLAFSIVNGVNPFIKNVDDITAFELFVNNSMNNPLINYEGLLKFLVNAQDDNGNTILHLIAFGECLKTIKSSSGQQIYNENRYDIFASRHIKIKEHLGDNFPRNFIENLRKINSLANIKKTQDKFLYDKIQSINNYLLDKNNKETVDLAQKYTDDYAQHIKFIHENHDFMQKFKNIYKKILIESNFYKDTEHLLMGLLVNYFDECNDYIYFSLNINNFQKKLNLNAETLNTEINLAKQIIPKIKSSGKFNFNPSGYVHFKQQLFTKLSDNINIKNQNGKTPLHAAITTNNIPLVKLYLNNGADVNAKDNKGLSILHWAVLSQSEKNYKIIDLLLEHNVNINAQDNNGLTPLHYALVLGNDRLIDLLKHDADLNIKDGKGCSPKDYDLKICTDYKARYYIEELDVIKFFNIQQGTIETYIEKSGVIKFLKIQQALQQGTMVNSTINFFSIFNLFDYIFDLVSSASLPQPLKNLAKINKFFGQLEYSSSEKEIKTDDASIGEISNILMNSASDQTEINNSEQCSVLDENALPKSAEDFKPELLGAPAA